MGTGPLMKIEARGIGKTAGRHVLLHDISLEIPGGGAAVIIGPNGAGKTTLLRILGLLDKPSTGRLWIDGRPVDDLDAKKRTALRRRMGFIFQHPLLLNGTVLDNVRRALALRKQAFDRPKVEAALAAVGLEAKQARDVRVLSGGEKQRLQLARAMVLEPEILLADEPTSNLDPLSARTIEDQLQAMAVAGKTVILATHNIIQARLLGDELYFLKEGRLIQQGPPGQVLQNPATLDVAHFASLANVIRGRLARTPDDVSLLVGGTKIRVVSEIEEGPVSAILRPEDIILSREPFQSSARNVFRGRVETVDDLGLIVLVRVQCGDFAVRAAITRSSLQELAIRTGEDVVLTFKASAVLVFPAE
jgi:tungstate transport system ATP-binding protein